MNRIARVMILILAVCCLFLSCAQLRAQAPTGAEIPQATNLGIDAIDFSVHVEVGGQPQDPIPVDLSNQRTSLQGNTRHPATAFWPAHEDILPENREDISSFSIVRMACLTSATEYVQLDPAQPDKSDTMGSVRNHEDLMQGTFEFPNHSPSHSVTLDTKLSFILKTPVEQNSDPDETKRASSPFGRTTFELGVGTGLRSNEGFSTYKDNFTEKRRTHHAHKPSASAMIKSSFDSTATTQH